MKYAHRRLVFALAFLGAVIFIVPYTFTFPVWWVLLGKGPDEVAEAVCNRLDAAWLWASAGKDKEVRL